eukprot:81691_1
MTTPWIILISMLQRSFAVDLGPNTDLSGLGITVDVPNPGGSEDTTNDKWIEVIGSTSVEDWGVVVTLESSIYGFHPTEVSSITIAVNIACTSECDEFYSFGFGDDRFISFQHDADGGMGGGDGNAGGLFLYPQDGSSSLGIGDPSGFMLGRTTYGMRTTDVLTGGDGVVNVWQATRVGRNSPVVFTFTNDPANDQLSVTFTQEVTYPDGVTATFNTAAPTGSDFVFFESPDPEDSGSDHSVSFTITSGNTGELECLEPATFVWEELMTSQAGKPTVLHELSIDEETLTLTVDVYADYLGKITADSNNDMYGTTYVIDFEDFNAHSDDIREPGTCQNRDGDDFEDPTWDEVWAFSETPNAGHVGGVDYLAYPRSNWWTVAMSSDDVCTVTYSASFTWAELMDCKSYDLKTSYITSTDNDDDITLQGTLYINVVSPFDYKEDYGYYRVYQLVSQPFEIVISKTVYVLGDVGINLLTMDIIAVYKEGEENTFRLIVLTESAEYLRLSREGEGTEYLQVFAASDVDNEIESSNFATLEAAETGTDCLGNKDYICTQLWQITASDVQCTTDGIFTDFSGTYSIQFNAVCRDVADVGQDLYDYCDGWLGEHKDEIITDEKVLLQADLTWKDEICDPEIFEVQFEAEMEFYYDSFGTELPDEGHLYQVGEDTVYVKITTAYPSDHYDVFTTDLMGVWICTFDPLTDYDTDIAFEVDSQVGGCFSDARDSNDFTYHIFDSSDGTTAEDFVLDETTTTLESNEIQFQFDVPDKVQRDTLYIHAQIEISLVGDEGRRRVLLWHNSAMTNQMEHFVDRIPLGSSPQPKPVPQSPVHHPKYPLEGPTAPVQQPWVISLQSPWVMMIGGLLAVVLCVNIVVMGYTNCARPNRLRYSPVKGTDIDSEFDAASSERDAINVISE